MTTNTARCTRRRQCYALPFSISRGLDIIFDISAANFYATLISQVILSYFSSRHAIFRYRRFAITAAAASKMTDTSATFITARVFITPFIKPL